MISLSLNFCGAMRESLGTAGMKYDNVEKETTVVFAKLYLVGSYFKETIICNFIEL